jgi:L-threonylcarbamoyladenylate synthase
MDTIRLSQKSVNEAVGIIKEGGVVVFPTDTVYGFLADVSDKKAVARIYKIKKRPKSKPLAVFVKDIKMAKELAEISKEQEKILKKYWPGKYTFILNKKNQKGTVALRIPKYKPLNNLLKKINKPLAQTSVNISGQKELNKISDIIEKFKKQNILTVDGGNLKKSRPSKIIDLTGERLTRIR